MALELGRSPSIAPRVGVSLWSRLYGFGSVYAKTLRDSRLSIIIVAGLMAGVMMAAGAAVGSAFSTPSSRADLTRLVADLPPILAGLTGKPENVGTLGGYVTWKYGPVFVFAAALWSILALSGTLATEARRGSLDMVAAMPFGKRRIALEKLAAHLTGIAVITIVLAFAAWLVAAAFGTEPGDAISPQAAIGYSLWVALIAMFCGSIAFALAPFFGRASAAGIAGFVLVAGFLLNGYSTVIPALSGVANLSMFYWTTNHMPLSGLYDWISLVPVAVVAVVLFGVGVEAFARRDLGASSSIPTPSLPGAVLGLRGPVGRSFGERLPVGLAWGLGIGIVGLAFAAASGSLAAELDKMSPDTLQVFRNVLPNYDITTAGGLLQFAFAGLGYIVIGFAAATLVGGWGSDETSGRLEMLLTTPLVRRSWAVSGGIGVYLVIAVMTVIFSSAVGIGAVMAGSDPVTPMLGSVPMGLYAAALAGVGFAVGGIFRTTLAAEIVALVVTATFLIDLIAPPLKLPDWVHQLALSGHMGQSMVGIWDVPGLVACLILAAGGLAIGAWGLGRRDIAP